MSMIITTSGLIDQVRDGLDEYNNDTITDSDILQALNRKQRQAVNITSKHFEDAFVHYTTFVTSSGVTEYDTPNDTYGGRVEKLELLEDNDSPYEIKRISYRDGTNYEIGSSTNRPLAWAQLGNKIRLYPEPKQDKTIRVWYTKQPGLLVKDQGRVTVTNSGSNYVVVDTAGSDLTSETDELNSYVNIINQHNGQTKGTLQIQNISGNRITFKTSPTRSTVYGRTIDSSLPTDIALDDYLCVAKGTCIPELFDAYTDYLIQGAVVEIKRRLGDASQEDYVALQMLEREVERMWVGRENTKRVKKVSRRWVSGSPRRRYQYG